MQHALRKSTSKDWPGINIKKYWSVIVHCSESGTTGKNSTKRLAVMRTDSALVNINQPLKKKRNAGKRGSTGAVRYLSITSQ